MAPPFRQVRVLELDPDLGALDAPRDAAEGERSGAADAAADSNVFGAFLTEAREGRRAEPSMPTAAPSPNTALEWASASLELLSGGGLQSAIEGEPARVEVVLTLVSAQDGAASSAAALAATKGHVAGSTSASATPAGTPPSHGEGRAERAVLVARAVRCRFDGCLP